MLHTAMDSILIIDDEKEVIELLSLYLEKEGFLVTGVSDGFSGLEELSRKKYDCILLDIMLPEINGFQVLKQIRNSSSVPVIMISARVAASDKILGLDLGSDDYITKPFDPLEVVARVRSHIRRSRLTCNSLITAGPYKLDIDKCQFYVNGHNVYITAMEFQLLKLFISSPGRVFTKQQIIDAGWEEPDFVEDNSLMVALSKLRSKMDEECTIKNIRGLGYRLEIGDEA